MMDTYTWKLGKACIACPKQDDLQMICSEQGWHHTCFTNAHTPGYWQHKLRGTKFCWWVDDFGVGRTCDDIQHLADMLKQWYKYTLDWDGTTYCGLTLCWNYTDEQWVNVAVPGYTKWLLHKVNHLTPMHPQHSPHPTLLAMFGIAAQLMTPDDDSPPLAKMDKKKIQQIVGSLLFYAHYKKDSKSNQTNVHVDKPPPWLCGDKSRSHHQILCKQHDPQNS